MKKGQGDNSQASVPDLRKIQLVGRNVEIKKLKLGSKIKVSRIFSLVLKALKGENYEELGSGVRVPRKLQLDQMGLMEVVDTMPGVLKVVDENYQGFLKLTTDLREDEIQDLDLPDVFKVAEECWDFNGFQEAIENSLGKVLGQSQPKGKGKTPPQSKS